MRSLDRGWAFQGTAHAQTKQGWAFQEMTRVGGGEPMSMIASQHPLNEGLCSLPPFLRMVPTAEKMSYF